MAQYEHLPIYKAALDLQICFEGIVRHFIRYAQIHISNEKYTVVSVVSTANNLIFNKNIP